FTLDPARCKDAVEALATRDSPKDEAFMIVAGALGSTGSPEAQAALRDAITALAGKRDHQDVLIAELGSLDNPDRATEAYARDIVAHPSDSEVRNVAQLALGNMARTLSASEPDRSEALVSEALQQSNSARTLDDRLASIYTLGNTGSSRAFAALHDAVGDPDFRVRMAAAAALRFVEGPDVEQQLLTLAATDPEPSVRAEAAQALRERSVAATTFDALAELVRREPSEAVRQTLVSVISARAEQFPGAVGVLDWVAQHDPKQDVRRTAQLALLRLRA
ncbi:MAG: HEAT repeat domain-containing protein, partial [Solirubrobacteraceae bacterium]